jgi:hypothetical protein
MSGVNWGKSNFAKLDSQTASLDSQKQSEQSYPSRISRKLVSVRLPTQKLEKYKLWCFINKVDMQDAVEEALDWLTGQPDSQTATINDLIDSNDDRRDEDIASSRSTLNSGQLDSQTASPVDDDAKEGVLNFYSRTTGNRIKENDRQALKEVAHLEPYIIKAGIITSILRAKNRINSFRYCLGAIQEIDEAKPDVSYLHYVIDAFHRRPRSSESKPRRAPAAQTVLPATGAGTVVEPNFQGPERAGKPGPNPTHSSPTSIEEQLSLISED